MAYNIWNGNSNITTTTTTTNLERDAFVFPGTSSEPMFRTPTKFDLNDIFGEDNNKVRRNSRDKNNIKDKSNILSQSQPLKGEKKKKEMFVM